MSTSPAFAGSVNPGTPAVLTAANTAVDGTGATGRALVFTAGADGSLLERLRFMHKGTNVATVMRVFLNNGSDPEVAANNTLIGEKSIAAHTLTQVAESVPYDLVLNHPVGYTGANANRVYVTMGTAVAAGIHITPIGGDL